MKTTKNTESANIVKNLVSNGTPVPATTPAEKAAATRARNAALKAQAAKVAERKAENESKRKQAATQATQAAAQKQADKQARKDLSNARKMWGGFAKCAQSLGACCAALSNELDTPVIIESGETKTTTTGRALLTGAGIDLERTGGKLTPAAFFAVVSPLFKAGKVVQCLQRVPAIYADADAEGAEKICYLWNEKSGTHTPATLLVLRPVVKWSPAIVCRLLADSPRAAYVLEQAKKRNADTQAAKAFYINASRTATRANVKSTFEVLSREQAAQIVWAK